MRWKIFIVVSSILLGIVIYDEVTYNVRFIKKLSELQAKWEDSLIESR